MKDKTFLTCVGAIVMFLLALTVYPFLYGWALSVLWGWFVVPVFGAPQITVWYAYGLTLVAAMITGQTARVNGENKKAEWSTVIATMLSPLVIVFIGWIIHTYLV